MIKSMRIGFAALAGILLAASLAQADWVSDNGSLNVSNTLTAETGPSLFINGSTPYAAFSEYTGGTSNRIFVKHLNGSSWIQDGGSVNLSPVNNASSPSLCFSGSTPYIAWQGLNLSSPPAQIYVSYWNGLGWQQEGGSLNLDPTKNVYDPNLAIYSNTPWVAWYEYTVTMGIGRLYVKHWNGMGWQQDGGYLNLDPGMGATAPSITIYNGTPYVAWAEYASSHPQINVKSWGGASWSSLGSSLNINPAMDAGGPQVGVYNGTPYVAWHENSITSFTQINVKYWTGGAWAPTGGSLNVSASQNASNPSLYLYNGVPYVAWQESNGTADQIYVKLWNGSAWVQVGSSLNVDTGRNAMSASLFFSGDKPYVAWRETDASGYNQVYVKHYDSPTFTPTRTPTPTRTATRTASPTSTSTRTATSTATISPTPTSTATYVTPTYTGTSTITPTSTKTPTATSTPVSTSTPTTTATSAVSAVDLAGREVIAYPNPARQSMRFIMNLTRPAAVKVEIYNSAGERVATLADTLTGPGAYLTWNCADCAPGAYLARVFKNNAELVTLKVALVK
ncbi:MAG: T9SS type A sorting domain-containing protein [candidate division FCPU426 bacterium]